jgi:hypothetical protein
MKGMVAAGHELTASAGVEILEHGGNAFDAALAACFASFICESSLTSPAGGGFMMVRTSAGDVRLYDFFTDVPGKGREAFDGEIDFFSVDILFGSAYQELQIGTASAAVPGVMAGLDTVHGNHCTMPLEDILAPAIKYAREGIRLNARQAYFNSILSPMLTISDESRGVYAPGGHLLKEGEPSFNYKAKGIFDGEFFQQLDGKASKDSRFYNFFVTKEGKPYGHYNKLGALKPDDFEKVLRFTEEKIVELIEEIISGRIEVRPYRLGTESPCGYCKYKPVCRIDWQINDYNFLESLAKSEVLEKAGGG